MKKIITSLALLLFVSSIPATAFSKANTASGPSLIVNYNQTYTYEQMVKDIKALAKKYPDLIQYESIGQTKYGREVYAVSLGKGEAITFINGGTHAREWITTVMNMYMIEQYAIAYNEDRTIDKYNVRRILDNTTIWFVPMVNPDGVTLSQFGLKKFPSSVWKSLTAMNDGSKDFTRWKSNANGVDLNRNYDADWSLIQLDPGKPWYKFHRGAKPFSENEVKALVSFTENKDPEMVVSYHSSGRKIYWWFSQEGDIKKRDYLYAKQMAELTGYKVMPAKHDSTGGGTYTDWVTYKLDKPAFTIEVSPYVYEGSPSMKTFPEEWERNKAIGLYAAKASYYLYLKELKNRTAEEPEQQPEETPETSADPQAAA